MNYILFLILIFISAIFYNFGNFYSKIPGVSNNFWKIFFISILCVIAEYTIRVPAIFFLVKNMSSVLIYTIIQVITFFCVLLFSKFVLKEEVKTMPIIINEKPMWAAVTGILDRFLEERNLCKNVTSFLLKRVFTKNEIVKITAKIAKNKIMIWRKFADFS